MTRRMNVVDGRINGSQDSDVITRLIQRKSYIDESRYYCFRSVILSEQVLGPYEVLADHLYIEEATGIPMQVRLADPVNPWIRIRAGRAIKRPFTKFWIRAAQDTYLGITGIANGTRIYQGKFVVYASVGELAITDGARAGGLGMQFIVQNRTIAAPTSLVAFLGQPVPPNYYPTCGKYGGTMAVLNDSSSGRLLMRWGATPNHTGWPIEPKATITFDLTDDIIFNGQSLYFENESSPINAVIMTNLEADITDQVNPRNITLVGS